VAKREGGISREERLSWFSCARREKKEKKQLVV
jgi:hypothetical protein